MFVVKTKNLFKPASGEGRGVLKIGQLPKKVTCICRVELQEERDFRVLLGFKTLSRPSAEERTDSSAAAVTGSLSVL